MKLTPLVHASLLNLRGLIFRNYNIVPFIQSNIFYGDINSQLLKDKFSILSYHKPKNLY